MSEELSSNIPFNTQWLIFLQNLMGSLVVAVSIMLARYDKCWTGLLICTLYSVPSM